jgi:uncharacterized Zn finger protein (UPF0148 family)
MSDFDEEAERERLREKYERDQQRREATEQMSELLLQGATMTNAHCSECNDPIFRYDGQEFCPTCEKPVDRGTNGTGDSGEDATQGADEREDHEEIQVTSPDDSARVAFGSDAGEQSQPATTNDSRRRDRPPESEPQDSSTGRPGDGTEPSRQTQRQAGTEREQMSADPTRQTDDRSPRGGDDAQTHSVPGVDPEPRDGSQTGHPDRSESHDGHVMAARDSLERTLASFARKAEATDDPQRAREYLAAAREAAETMAALR